ncbi:antibiotic resistance protein [Agrobacterium cavarae]|uniref:Antibiotic resistance protein n=1 Tax=Agrobacterium cavarae TaxID=2528239 RepID=A0ABY1YBH2_9HYPH|nr:TfuA-like protein [Agrobacterium cavarae]TBN14112.1 antibiotic resistance protein [Agrobacterium cavarae]
MKIVFVGPTLPEAVDLVPPNVEVRGPAKHTDILAAVTDGATVIGLIDGNFEDVAPIWHKEILFSLSQGVRVYGSSSMGALRAAECAAFGMIGIGKIYSRYVSGELVDDSDVAQIHGPREMNYVSLSEPLVNVLATLDDLLLRRELDHADYDSLRTSAEMIFFKERTYRAIVANANLPDHLSRESLTVLLRTNAINQKRLDALELLKAIAAADDRRVQVPTDWTFASTRQWRKIL